METLIAYNKKYQQINNVVSSIFWCNFFWSRTLFKSFLSFCFSGTEFKHKVTGLGADGASVNREDKSSVKTKFQKMSWLIFGWCMAHQLELGIQKGFPNNSKEWEGIRNISGGIFLLGGGTLGRVILATKTFFKAKNSILWILNIKITMNYVSKEDEIKTKMMVNEEWSQLKTKFLLVFI